MKKIKLNYLLLIFLFVGFAINGCTDLEEEVLNEQLGADLVSNPSNFKGLANPAYAKLRTLNEFWGFWGLQEATTDEAIFPTRGTDWYDGGFWQQDHLHTWGAQHSHIINAWNAIFEGISKSNTGIFYLSEFPESAAINDLINELRVLRAFYVYLAVDNFGQVPFREADETDFSVLPEVMNRAEATAWLIAELNAVIPTLKLKSAVPYGTVSKGAAQTLLAKIYLNHEVYTGTPKWAEVIPLCDAVISSGEYTVADDYWTMFQYENDQHPESIFTFLRDDNYDLGGGGVWTNFTLHYHQTFGNYNSLWNGGSTTKTFFEKWTDTDDERYSDPDERIKETTGLVQGFLVGQQYGVDGTALETRDNEPLVFVPEINITNAPEYQGVRVVKYAPNPNTVNQFVAGNDFHFFRISDVHLMRAEAQFRVNGGGLADVNLIRSKRGVPALGALTLPLILDERGFELYWEGHRRQDLIRFGKFNDAYSEKGVTPAHTQLFPIPQSALDVNENLVQNPGY